MLVYGVWCLPDEDSRCHRSRTCQAMFMTAARYQQCGPFPDEVMMEDFELTRRIRAQAIAEGGR